MSIKKYNEFTKESHSVLDGPVLSSDDRLLRRAKFKKGDKVDWSEGGSDWYTIDYAFVDMGTILYNLRNPEGISSGGRVREDELTRYEEYE